MTDLMITEQDVSTFRTKLDDWGSGLSDGERAILQLVVVRAFPESTESSEPEVEGFVTPRDSASGLATGKRMHKPFTLTKQMDVSTPMLRSGGLDSFVGISFSVADER
jgi:hypothetical protein